MTIKEEIDSILKNPEKRETCWNYHVAFDNKWNPVALECNPERTYFQAVAKGYDPLIIPVRNLSLGKK